MHYVLIVSYYRHSLGPPFQRSQWLPRKIVLCQNNMEISQPTYHPSDLSQIILYSKIALSCEGVALFYAVIQPYCRKVVPVDYYLVLSQIKINESGRASRPILLHHKVRTEKRVFFFLVTILNYEPADETRKRNCNKLTVEIFESRRLKEELFVQRQNWWYVLGRRKRQIFDLLPVRIITLVKSPLLLPVGY